VIIHYVPVLQICCVGFARWESGKLVRLSLIIRLIGNPLCGENETTDIWVCHGTNGLAHKFRTICYSNAHGAYFLGPERIMKDKILKAINSPYDLEVLYRENPQEFTRAFPQVFAENSDSSILHAWHERLFFNDGAESNEQAPASRGRATDIGLTIVLALIAGTLAKWPHIFPMLNEK